MGGRRLQLGLALGFMTCALAFAGVRGLAQGTAPVIAYEGHVEADGLPLNATITFNFALFPCADPDGAVAGTCNPLWVADGDWNTSATPLMSGWPSDAGIPVQVNAGHFAVELGGADQAALGDNVFASSGLYLAIEVDGTPLTQLQAIRAAVSAFNGVPPGSITYYAGTSIPAGWLLANGASVSRTTYPALFAAIGTHYNPGADANSFNLPNLTDGRFVMGGTSGSLGQIGGQAALSLSSDGSHSHALPFGDSTTIYYNNGRILDSGCHFNYALTASAHSPGNHCTGRIWSYDAGSHTHGGPYENRPPFMIALPIIKY